MQWGIKLSKPVERWLGELDHDGFLRVCAALDILAESGPRLGRPLVHPTYTSPDRRELRIAGRRGSELRVRYSIDDAGYAVLLRDVRPHRQRPGRHARAGTGPEAADRAAEPYVEWAELRPGLDLDEAKVLRYKARLRSELSGQQLAELRKARLLSQADLAFVIGVRRSKVARIEAGELEAARLGLLRAYVQSLGGRLEVAATFSDRRVPLVP